MDVKFSVGHRLPSDTYAIISRLYSPRIIAQGIHLHRLASLIRLRGGNHHKRVDPEFIVTATLKLPRCSRLRKTSRQSSIPTNRYPSSFLK